MINVSLLAERLRNVMALAGRATPREASILALKAFLFEAEQDTLRVTATDMIVGIRLTMAATVHQAGSELYDSEMLSQWIGKISDGELTFRAEAQGTKRKTEFRSGRTTYSTQGLDPEHFPVLPVWEECEPLATINAEDLDMMLRRAVVCAETPSAASSRPVLECVFLDICPDRLVLASADGFRMAFMQKAHAFPVEEQIRFLVPKRSAMALLALMAAEDPATVDFALTPNGSQLMARFGPVEWVTALVEGTAPDVRQILPTTKRGEHTEIVVSVDSLLAAVKPLAVLAKNNNHVVHLQAEAGDDQALVPGSIRMWANSVEVAAGEAYCDAMVSLPDGQSQAPIVAFDSHYLLDVLNSERGVNLVIRLTGSNTSVCFHRENIPDGDMHHYVVMPMVFPEGAKK